MDVFATCLRSAAVLCVIALGAESKKNSSVPRKEVEPVLEGYCLQKNNNTAKITQHFFHKP